MPILNWIGKEKIVNHDKELPYRVLKPRQDLSVGENSENLLIQGDNLEALKSLLPQYQGKVKCIYIDPPYNTGNEGWVYNDKVNSPQIKQWLNKVVGAEGEDLCRHDKWLCMMYPRLRLLRELLAEDGAIFVSIDDDEVHHLRVLLDEVFGTKNFVANIIWEKKFSPQNDAKWLSDSHDHIVLYAKSKDIWRPNLLVRTELADSRYSNPDNDPRGDWTSSDLSVRTYNSETDYEITSPSGRKVKPASGRCWGVNREKFKELAEDNRIWFGEKGNNKPRIKTFLSEVQAGIVPKTIWYRSEVGDNQEAKKEVNLFLKETETKFETPKPTKLIKQIIRLAVKDGDIVLDSFAGSGTTGQAVLELNKENFKSLKFILVELEKDISENVTAKRLAQVVNGIEGVKYPDGTGQGFQYLDLNGELFDSSGMINRDAHYEDLAGYIYFSETGKHVSLEAIKSPWIGEFNGVHYFLLFSKPDKNILDEAWLKKYATGEGHKIVYADKSLVDEEVLSEYGVVFKQIPYELRQF